MEELIKQAFLHVDVIGPHVHEGHYDLIGPDGEIILPQVWETMIQPDWSITMHMWPMPDKSTAPPPAGKMGRSPPPPPMPPSFEGPLFPRRKSKNAKIKRATQELPLQDDLPSPEIAPAHVMPEQQKRTEPKPESMDTREHNVTSATADISEHLQFPKAFQNVLGRPSGKEGDAEHDVTSVTADIPEHLQSPKPTPNILDRPVKENGDAEHVAASTISAHDFRTDKGIPRGSSIGYRERPP